MAKGGSRLITAWCALVFGSVQVPDSIVGAGAPVLRWRWGHGRLHKDNDGDFAVLVLFRRRIVDLENWRTQVRQTFGVFLLVVIFLWLLWWKKNTYSR